MLQIGNHIVSLDVVEKHFVCDLNKCKGICCVEGAAGAPLEDDELELLEQVYPIVKPYLPQKAIDEIERQGFYVVDYDGDKVTPTINNEDCVYAYTNEDGIVKCAIEKAYFEGKVSFRKPISCHLYPIRIQGYKDFDAVNYDKQNICKPACQNGDKLKVPIYIFLKDSLIRKYGKEWYDELVLTAEEYLKYKNSK